MKKEIAFLKTTWWKEVQTAVVVFVALLGQVLAIVCLYMPAGVVNGGFTGIGMLLDYATGGVIQSWMAVVVLNIPLLAYAMRKLNVRFAIYTVCTAAMLALLLAIVQNLNLPPVFDMDDPIMPLISVLFGSVIIGGAAALIVRQGASAGGTDVIAILVNRALSFPVGTVNMAINLCILLAFAFVSNMEMAALSAVGLFVSSMAFNNALLGLNRTKTLFIISEKWEAIAPQVLSDARRGVTLIPCKGAFTGRDKTMVYIIARTIELAQIRKIVLEHDENALISIIDTREVLGSGFAPLR
ncbi:MAG: YitT family protein [Clostridiales bacterium]|nr:YitT family protein [Clostridiales bacterium]